MRRLKLPSCVAVLCLAAACATFAVRRDFESLPLLAPSAYGAEGQMLQHLTLTRDGGSGDALSIDAAVEVDAGELRVAGFLLGQRILLLTWDGRQLQEAREPAVPQSLQGRAVLRDLQLVYWPAEAIRVVLPRGWRLEEKADRRRLYRGATVVFESARSDAVPLGSATLWNRLGHYRINIESSYESR